MSRPCLTLLLLLAWISPVAADVLARYTSPDGAIDLLDQRCAGGAGKIQQARKQAAAGRLDGCWAVNAKGNPVVVWSDGTVDELDHERVRLSPKYTALLEEATQARAPAVRDRPASQFARPAWCASASFAHEKAICRDRDLAAADLALAPLWRSYRETASLNAVQQGRTKSAYFQRLKACGAQRACIAREQRAQARFYREQLARR